MRTPIFNRFRGMLSPDREDKPAQQRRKAGWYRQQFEKTNAAIVHRVMETFGEWLSNYDLLAQLRLLENYVTFNPAQYNELFDQELAKVIERTVDPTHRQVLEKMRGFDWMAYIGGSVRHAGYRDYREGQEKIHDLAVKLLTGKLFRGFDERTSGPMLLRFKSSVKNAILNLLEKERTRRHYLPTVSIHQQFEPGTVTPDDLPARSSPAHDEEVIEKFRELVHNRLGDLGLAILDLRLAGEETKSLVGSPAVGSPGRYVVKRQVQEIKKLAREFAVSMGDMGLLRRVEKAMEDQAATVRKRLNRPVAG